MTEAGQGKLSGQPRSMIAFFGAMILLVAVAIGWMILKPHDRPIVDTKAQCDSMMNLTRRDGGSYSDMFKASIAACHQQGFVDADAAASFFLKAGDMACAKEALKVGRRQRKAATDTDVIRQVQSSTATGTCTRYR